MDRVRELANRTSRKEQNNQNENLGEHFDSKLDLAEERIGNQDKLKEIIRMLPREK
jgi:hypothetical protein